MKLEGIANSQATLMAQGLIKEYGPFMEMVIEAIKKEYDTPINKETAEQVGLEYARRQAAKEALRLFIQRLNSISNERN